MRTVALSHYAEVFNGKTPSKAEQRESGRPVLKIRDVDEKGQFRQKYESFVDPAFAEKFAKKQIKPGDTLILNAAHNADYVGSKSFFATVEVDGAIATGEWLIVRPRSDMLDARFASHWLTSDQARREIRELVKGIHLYPKDVARLSIPLPPLAEQKRIAAILDQADELRRKRQRAIDRLNQLGQAIFHEMFGDIRNGSKKFATHKLGEIADVRLGKMLDKNKSKGGTMRPYLRNANVRWFDFDLSDISEMEFTDQELDRFSLINGDLLICEGGEPGRCAVWRGGEREIFYQKALHRARVDPKIILPEYLGQWFFNAAQYGVLADSVTSATIAHLTGEKIKKLDIIVPPIDKQRDFVWRLEQVNSLLARYQSADLQGNTLFSSLQHRAFQGEL